MKTIISMTHLVAIMVSLLSVSRCVAQSDKPLKGEILYKQFGCSGCHGKHGKSPYDLTRNLGTKSNEEIKAFIKDPAFFGNRTMPPFKSTLTESELGTL